MSRRRLYLCCGLVALCAILTVVAAMLIGTAYPAYRREFSAMSDNPATSGVDYFGVGWSYAICYILPAFGLQILGGVAAVIGAFCAKKRPLTVLFGVWAALLFLSIPFILALFV